MIVVDGLARRRVDVPHAGVFELGMDGDRHVGRQGPGRGRPDHGVPAGRRRPRRARHARDQREIDVNAGRRLLAVFQLGLGQGRAIGHAPVDRLELAADEAPLDQVGQDVEDARLVPRVERQVGIVPVAHDAEPVELGALNVDPLHGLGLAQGADLGVAHRGGLGTEVLDHLVLDRQAVAVPARDVRAVEPGHRQRSNHEVLEHLVEQGPHVDLAVGVGGTVVQDLAWPAGADLPDLSVEVLLAPPGLDLRLADRQVRLHVEAGRPAG